LSLIAAAPEGTACIGVLRDASLVETERHRYWHLWALILGARR
jgi:hypothetical protein